MKNLIALLTLFIVLAFQGTAGINTSKTSKNNQASGVLLKTEITSQDITAYLVEYGYFIQTTPQHIYGTSTWFAYTSKGRSNYLTYVYTNGYSILGHEDIPI